MTDISAETRARVRSVWPDMMRELATGDLVSAVLARHGVSDDVKRAYLAIEPGARKQWEDAREASADAYYEEALEVARKAPSNRGAPSDAHAQPVLDAQERRLLVDTLKWAARIRNPRLYSDKQTLDVNVRTVDLTRIISDANARLAAARPGAALIDGRTGALVPDGAGAPDTQAILESMLGLTGGAEGA